MEKLKPTESPLESLSVTIPFSSKDWGKEKRDAWIYGIICGWDDNCFSEFEMKFGWNIETFERLKRLHEKFELLRAAPENKLLTLEQLRQMDADMKNRRWVWIEVLKPYRSDEKVSAYYRVQSDYTRDRAFCCGYPGIGFSFDYSDYGITWLAYAHKPEGAETK